MIEHVRLILLYFSNIINNFSENQHTDVQIQSNISLALSCFMAVTWDFFWFLLENSLAFSHSYSSKLDLGQVISIKTTEDKYLHVKHLLCQHKDLNCINLAIRIEPKEFLSELCVYWGYALANEFTFTYSPCGCL